MTEKTPGGSEPEDDSGEASARAPVSEATAAYITTLFQRYRESLHRYLSRLVATDEVPDLVQETYVRLLRHEHVVQIDALARGLLFHTATNLARDHHRRQVSRHAALHEQIADNLDAGAVGGPEERLASEQTLELIARTLAGLPGETRAVFVLSRFKDMSYPDIAKALRIGQRTVARRMAEALDALSTALRSM